MTSLVSISDTLKNICYFNMNFLKVKVLKKKNHQTLKLVRKRKSQLE